MYSSWVAVFIWSVMFTTVTAGQVILWWIRVNLKCSDRERELRLDLFKGCSLALVFLLLWDASLILAHLHGKISLEGVL